MFSATKPRVPEGLRDLMKDLTREILKEKPRDIYNFAEYYFQSRLPEKEHYKVKKFEDNSGKYDFSYIQNSQRHQIPVALVYSIIPESLTNLIKDLIKAILREQPENLCDFAVEYFRHLKATMKNVNPTENMEKEINYSSYENYFNNKERFLLTPYVKCKCGRILGESEVSNYNVNQNDDTNDKNKGQRIAERDFNFTGKYLNSVIIIQRYFRRYLIARNAKTNVNETAKDSAITEQLNQTSNQSKIIIPQLHLNQVETENVSEDASYTSASTALLSASESGRDNSDLSTTESIPTKTIIEREEIENNEKNTPTYLKRTANIDTTHQSRSNETTHDNSKSTLNDEILNTGEGDAHKLIDVQSDNQRNLDIIREIKAEKSIEVYNEEPSKRENFHINEYAPNSSVTDGSVSFFEDRKEINSELIEAQPAIEGENNQNEIINASLRTKEKYLESMHKPSVAENMNADSENIRKTSDGQQETSLNKTNVVLSESEAVEVKHESNKPQTHTNYSDKNLEIELENKVFPNENVNDNGSLEKTIPDLPSNISRDHITNSDVSMEEQKLLKSNKNYAHVEGGYKGLSTKEDVNLMIENSTLNKDGPINKDDSVNEHKSFHGNPNNLKSDSETVQHVVTLSVNELNAPTTDVATYKIPCGESENIVDLNSNHDKSEHMDINKESGSLSGNQNIYLSTLDESNNSFNEQDTIPPVIHDEKDKTNSDNTSEKVKRNDNYSELSSDREIEINTISKAHKTEFNSPNANKSDNIHTSSIADLIPENQQTDSILKDLNSSGIISEGDNVNIKIEKAPDSSTDLEKLKVLEGSENTENDFAKPKTELIGRPEADITVESTLEKNEMESVIIEDHQNTLANEVVSEKTKDKLPSASMKTEMYSDTTCENYKCQDDNASDDTEANDILNKNFSTISLRKAKEDQSNANNSKQNLDQNIVIEKEGEASEINIHDLRESVNEMKNYKNIKNDTTENMNGEINCDKTFEEKKESQSDKNKSSQNYNMKIEGSTTEKINSEYIRSDVTDNSETGPYFKLNVVDSLGTDTISDNIVPDDQLNILQTRPGDENIPEQSIDQHIGMVERKSIKKESQNNENKSSQYNVTEKEGSKIVKLNSKNVRSDVSDNSETGQKSKLNIVDSVASNTVSDNIIPGDQSSTTLQTRPSDENILEPSIAHTIDIERRKSNEEESQNDNAEKEGSTIEKTSSENIRNYVSDNSETGQKFELTIVDPVEDVTIIGNIIPDNQSNTTFQTRPNGENIPEQNIGMEERKSNENGSQSSKNNSSQNDTISDNIISNEQSNTTLQIRSNDEKKPEESIDQNIGMEGRKANEKDSQSGKNKLSQNDDAEKEGSTIEKISSENLRNDVNDNSESGEKFKLNIVDSAGNDTISDNIIAGGQSNTTFQTITSEENIPEEDIAQNIGMEERNSSENESQSGKNKLNQNYDTEKEASIIEKINFENIPRDVSDNPESRQKFEPNVVDSVGNDTISDNIILDDQSKAMLQTRPSDKNIPEENIAQNIGKERRKSNENESQNDENKWSQNYEAEKEGSKIEKLSSENLRSDASDNSETGQKFKLNVVDSAGNDKTSENVIPDDQSYTTLKIRPTEKNKPEQSIDHNIDAKERKSNERECQNDENKWRQNNDTVKEGSTTEKTNSENVRSDINDNSETGQKFHLNVVDSAGNDTISDNIIPDDQSNTKLQTRPSDENIPEENIAQNIGTERKKSIEKESPNDENKSSQNYEAEKECSTIEKLNSENVRSDISDNSESKQKFHINVDDSAGNDAISDNIISYDQSNTTLQTSPSDENIPEEIITKNIGMARKKSKEKESQNDEFKSSQKDTISENIISDDPSNTTEQSIDKNIGIEGRKSNEKEGQNGENKSSHNYDTEKEGFTIESINSENITSDIGDNPETRQKFELNAVNSVGHNTISDNIIPDNQSKATLQTRPSDKNISAEDIAQNMGMERRKSNENESQNDEIKSSQNYNAGKEFLMIENLNFENVRSDISDNSETGQKFKLNVVDVIENDTISDNINTGDQYSTISQTKPGDGNIREQSIVQNMDMEGTKSKEEESQSDENKLSQNYDMGKEDLSIERIKFENIRSVVDDNSDSEQKFKLNAVDPIGNDTISDNIIPDHLSNTTLQTRPSDENTSEQSIAHNIDMERRKSNEKETQNDENKPIRNYKTEKIGSAIEKTNSENVRSDVSDNSETVQTFKLNVADSVRNNAISDNIIPDDQSCATSEKTRSEENKSEQSIDQNIDTEEGKSNEERSQNYENKSSQNYGMEKERSTMISNNSETGEKFKCNVDNCVGIDTISDNINAGDQCSAISQTGPSEENKLEQSLDQNIAIDERKLNKNESQSDKNKSSQNYDKETEDSRIEKINTENIRNDVSDNSETGQKFKLNVVDSVENDTISGNIISDNQSNTTLQRRPSDKNISEQSIAQNIEMEGTKSKKEDSQSDENKSSQNYDMKKEGSTIERIKSENLRSGSGDNSESEQKFKLNVVDSVEKDTISDNIISDNQLKTALQTRPSDENIPELSKTQTIGMERKKSNEKESQNDENKSSQNYDKEKEDSTIEKINSENIRSDVSDNSETVQKFKLSVADSVRNNAISDNIIPNDQSYTTLGKTPSEENKPAQSINQNIDMEERKLNEKESRNDENKSSQYYDMEKELSTMERMKSENIRDDVSDNSETGQKFNCNVVNSAGNDSILDNIIPDNQSNTTLETRPSYENIPQQSIVQNIGIEGTKSKKEENQSDENKSSQNYDTEKDGSAIEKTNSENLRSDVRNNSETVHKFKICGADSVGNDTISDNIIPDDHSITTLQIRPSDENIPELRIAQSMDMEGTKSKEEEYQSDENKSSQNYDSEKDGSTIEKTNSENIRSDVSDNSETVHKFKICGADSVRNDAISENINAGDQCSPISQTKPSNENIIEQRIAHNIDMEGTKSKEEESQSYENKLNQNYDMEKEGSTIEKTNSENVRSDVTDNTETGQKFKLNVVNSAGNDTIADNIITISQTGSGEENKPEHSFDQNIDMGKVKKIEKNLNDVGKENIRFESTTADTTDNMKIKIESDENGENTNGAISDNILSNGNITPNNNIVSVDKSEQNERNLNDNINTNEENTTRIYRNISNESENEKTASKDTRADFTDNVKIERCCTEEPVTDLKEQSSSILIKTENETENEFDKKKSTSDEANIELHQLGVITSSDNKDTVVASASDKTTESSENTSTPHEHTISINKYIESDHSKAKDDYVSTKDNGVGELVKENSRVQSKISQDDSEFEDLSTLNTSNKIENICKINDKDPITKMASEANENTKTTQQKQELGPKESVNISNHNEGDNPNAMNVIKTMENLETSAIPANLIMREDDFETNVLSAPIHVENFKLDDLNTIDPLERSNEVKQPSSEDKINENNLSRNESVNNQDNKLKYSEINNNKGKSNEDLNMIGSHKSSHLNVPNNKSDEAITKMENITETRLVSDVENNIEIQKACQQEIIPHQENHEASSNTLPYDADVKGDDTSDQATTLSIGNKTPKSVIGIQNFNIDRIRFYNEGLLGSISGQRFAETHLRSFWKEYLMNNSKPLGQYDNEINEMYSNQLLNSEKYEPQESNSTSNFDKNQHDEEQENTNVEPIILKETAKEPESTPANKQNLPVTHIINKDVERIPRYFYGALEELEDNKTVASKPKTYKEPLAFIIPIDDINKARMTKTYTGKKLTTTDTNHETHIDIVQKDLSNNFTNLDLTSYAKTEPLLEAETPPKLFEDLNQFEHRVSDVDLGITYTINEILNLKYDDDLQNNSDENDENLNDSISDYSLTPEPMLQTIIELSESETPRPMGQLQSNNDNNTDSLTAESNEDNSLISDELLKDENEKTGGIYEYSAKEFKNVASLNSETLNDNSHVTSPNNTDTLKEVSKDISDQQNEATFHDTNTNTIFLIGSSNKKDEKIERKNSIDDIEACSENISIEEGKTIDNNNKNKNDFDTSVDLHLKDEILLDNKQIVSVMTSPPNNDSLHEGSEAIAAKKIQRFYRQHLQKTANRDRKIDLETDDIVKAHDVELLSTINDSLNTKFNKNDPPVEEIDIDNIKKEDNIDNDKTFKDESCSKKEIQKFDDFSKNSNSSDEQKSESISSNGNSEIKNLNKNSEDCNECTSAVMNNVKTGCNSNIENSNNQPLCKAETHHEPHNFNEISPKREKSSFIGNLQSELDISANDRLCQNSSLQNDDPLHENFKDFAAKKIQRVYRQHLLKTVNRDKKLNLETDDTIKAHDVELVSTINDSLNAKFNKNDPPVEEIEIDNVKKENNIDNNKTFKDERCSKEEIKKFVDFSKNSTSSYEQESESKSLNGNSEIKNYNKKSEDCNECTSAVMNNVKTGCNSNIENNNNQPLCKAEKHHEPHNFNEISPKREKSSFAGNLQSELVISANDRLCQNPTLQKDDPLHENFKEIAAKKIQKVYRQHLQKTTNRDKKVDLETDDTKPPEGVLEIDNVKKEDNKNNSCKTFADERNSKEQINKIGEFSKHSNNSDEQESEPIDSNSEIKNMNNDIQSSPEYNRDNENNNNQPLHKAEKFHEQHNIIEKSFIKENSSIAGNLQSELNVTANDISNQKPSVSKVAKDAMNTDKAAKIIQQFFKKNIKPKHKSNPNNDLQRTHWFVGDEPIVANEEPPPLTKTKSEISFDETEAYVVLTTNLPQYLVDSNSSEVIDTNSFSRTPTASITNQSSGSCSSSSSSEDSLVEKCINLPKGSHLTDVSQPVAVNDPYIGIQSNDASGHEANEKKARYANLIDQFITSERFYSGIVNHNYSYSDTKDIQFPSSNITEITKILTEFLDSQNENIKSDIRYEILEEPCIKKTVDEEILSSTNSSSSEIDDADDSLGTKTVKLQKPEIAIIKMQKRRNSTSKISSLDNLKDYNFNEPSVTSLENLDTDEEGVVVARLQRDETRESTGQSDVDVVIGSTLKEDDSNSHENFNFDSTFPSKGSLKRVHTIGDEVEAKLLLKNVTIDESIKYIEPPDYELNDCSLCLDDETTANIRHKMMAYSLSEADSDALERTADNLDRNSWELRNKKYDDFNISTALIDNGDTSTETESTSVSAVTKIQTGTRGSLNSSKASIGNAAISESLEHLVKEAAAKRIQKTYRQHYRLKTANPNDKIKSSPECTTSMETTLAQKRSIMLQRGDALQNGSSPEEGTSSSGNSGENENGKINSKVEDAFCVKSKTLPEQESKAIFTDNATSSYSLPSSANSAAVIRAKKIEDNKRRWIAMRQNSMPVQIDSEVLRVIPKYIRKKIKSAEGEKKKQRRHMLMD